MWICTPEKSTPSVLPQKVGSQPAPIPSPPQFSAAADTLPGTSPADSSASPKKGKVVWPENPPAKHLPRAMAACTGLYGCGLLLSGIVLAACNGQTARFLQYYVQNWISLFSIGTRPLHLFSTIFLSGILSMALLVLFGVSACGIPLIAILLIGKGTGSGLLSLELFLLHGWKGLLLYILCPAISDVFLAWCLCSAGTSAMRVSRSLWARCRQNPVLETSSAGIHLLINRCLFLCTLQILFCAVSAVLCPYIAAWLAL